MKTEEIIKLMQDKKNESYNFSQLLQSFKTTVERAGEWQQQRRITPEKIIADEILAGLLDTWSEVNKVIEAMMEKYHNSEALQKTIQTIKKA